MGLPDVDWSETAIGTAPPGPTVVPAGRYTDPHVAGLEAERLWPSVWQVACTLDHVAAPGDVFELRCGALSVLVVRGDDGELRAFQNACRHRGTSLVDGAASGLTELRCPFHRWSWDLSGELREVPDLRGFGMLDRSELGLVPARVGTWGPLVFVSAGSSGMPLDEWLEGVPDDAAWARLEEFRCVVTTTTPVDANWKVLSDGFSETYHVQGLHPEMLGSIDDVHAPQRLWSRHGVSYQRYGVPSPRLGLDISEEEVWASFCTTQSGRLGPDAVVGSPMPTVPAGSTIRDVMAAMTREVVTPFGGAASMASFSTDEVLGLSQYNLFPNCTVLVWGEMVNVLIARPAPGPAVDPHRAELVSFLLMRHGPTGELAPPPAVTVDPAAGGDLGWILNQDVGIVERVHRGLCQPGLTEVLLSSEERRISHFHRNLEAWLEQ